MRTFGKLVSIQTPEAAESACRGAFGAKNWARTLLWRRRHHSQQQLELGRPAHLSVYWCTKTSGFRGEKSDDKLGVLAMCVWWVGPVYELSHPRVHVRRWDGGSGSWTSCLRARCTWAGGSTGTRSRADFCDRHRYRKVRLIRPRYQRKSAFEVAHLIPKMRFWCRWFLMITITFWKMVSLRLYKCEERLKLMILYRNMLYRNLI